MCMFYCPYVSQHAGKWRNTMSIKVIRVIVAAESLQGIEDDYKADHCCPVKS
jgi:hypothetical protein